MNFPAWFNITEYIFHSIVDVLCLVFTGLALAAVAKSRWREHLAWLVPTVAANALNMIYRVVLDAHFFLGFGSRSLVFVVSRSVFYVADIFYAYAAVQLWRTVKSIASPPAAHEPETETAQEGVWPPPPLRTRE